MLARRPSRGNLIRGTAAALAGAGLWPRTVRAQTINWRCGSGNGGSTPVNVRLKEAFAKIRVETNGELDIKHYPDSQLGSDPALIPQVRLGAAPRDDDDRRRPGSDSLVPVAAIENAPFAFPNYETAWRAFDGDLGKIVRAALMTVGMYVFEHPYDNGLRQFTTSVKLRSAASTICRVCGFRVPHIAVSHRRVSLDGRLADCRSPTTELYTALQTHVVDGQETPLVSVESDRFFEVQKYCSLTNHMWGAFWVFVNKAKWDSLTPKLQDVMVRNVNAFAFLQPAKDDERQLDVTLVDKLTRQGMSINKVDGSSFKAKLRASGFYRTWRNEWGAAAWSALEKYSGPLA